jgi:lipoic acid synthetase
MTQNIEEINALFRPGWVRGRVSWKEDFKKVRELIRDLGLNSVCVSAKCPNKGECWERRHVTFMILGDSCTRNCLFCGVKSESAGTVDSEEPGNVSRAVKELGAIYAVITSVTRDDLWDRGAGQFLKTVNAIKKENPKVLVEFLIPDLNADEAFLGEIAFSGADVIGHNIEMPEKFYPDLRPEAGYERSLKALEILKTKAAVPIKSSMMVGLGEKERDIFRTLEDLKDAGVDIVYIGQYLAPSKDHWPVKRYYSPSEFHSLRKRAEEMGFKAVCAGPMVRSSYRAYEAYLACTSNLDRRRT